MSSDQILSAADSASCPPTSEDSGEIFLASEEGWKEEANSVIRDVEKFVQFIAIADKIKSSQTHIFLNVTTLEKQEVTIELSAVGFRIVGHSHNEIESKEVIDERYVFETPYSLLESISPAYIQEFGKCLSEKLNNLQQD